MIKDEIRDILRSPDNLKMLYEKGPGKLRSEDGQEYPIIDNILCMLKEEERVIDQGDDNFYEKYPFGERDWSNPDEIESGVEEELKCLLTEYPKAAIIVDVGAGTGRISNYLSLKSFENAVSLDYSIISLRQVVANSNNVCIWGNNLHLPFSSSSVDMVISSGVIHHTPDPEKAFEECERVLKPGGRIYLRVYNKYSLYGFLYHTYGAFIRSLESIRATFLVDVFGFYLYRLAWKLLNRSVRKGNSKILRAKFANLFCKKMVHFFTNSEIDNLINKNQLIIESAKKRGLAHRMHCYVARKT